MPKVPYCGRSMFYQEAGEGPVLIFLHGNTASSRLFEPLLPLYTPHFRCVLLDFLGNGRSDRVESFPADLWQEEARQALALIRAAGYERPCLLGTSGGAWAAMNAALLAPGAVGAVVADSFDGRSLHPGFARDAINVSGSQFFVYAHCKSEILLLISFHNRCLISTAVFIETIPNEVIGRYVEANCEL